MSTGTTVVRCHCAEASGNGTLDGSVECDAEACAEVMSSLEVVAAARAEFN